MFRQLFKFLTFIVVVTLHPINTFAASDITWVGCGITKNAFTKEMASAFESHTRASVEVRGGGALKGIRDASAGRADIGGTCRYALDLPEEADANLYHVAWDALVMIVPTTNPVQGLSSEQVQDVIDAKITNWSDVGGDDIPIEFYARRGNLSGVGHMFRVQFFKNPDKVFTAAQEVPRSSGLVEMLVGKGGGSLGISGASSAHKRKGVKMLSLDGVYPSKENIVSGKYHLIRPLYYATGPQPSDHTQKFIEFALSPQGQSVIANEDVVNLKEGQGLSRIFRDRFGAQYLAPSVK